MDFIYCDDHVTADEKEDDRLCEKESESKPEFNKMGERYPLTLDVKSIPYYIGFLSNLAEHIVSAPLSPFCRPASLFSIPISLRSSDLFVEGFRHRRIRSTCDIGDIFVEYAFEAAGPGNLLVTPSAQCIFDSVERSLAARSYMKSPLFSQLGSLNAATRKFRATSFGTSPMKHSEFIGARNALSSKTISEVTSPSGQISNTKNSEKLLVSSSSTNSTSSYQSYPSPSLNVSKGVLCCVWKDGSLNILFNEGDDSGKMYVANLHKVDASIDKALDCLYVFYSRTGNKSPEIVGKMKVFSSLILNRNGSKLVETEFVLFGVENNSKEVQGSTNSPMKIRGLCKKVPKIFKPTNSSKHRAMSKIGDPRFQLESFLQDEELEFANHIEKGLFRPSLEQAAIVIKSSPHDCSKNEVESGGWGLKFLEKVAMDCKNISIEDCETSDIKDINVLIPTGFHGDPIKGDCGPSSLMERWTSGGSCDCGGWDIGCPLSILHDENSAAPKASFNDYSQENSQTVDLFMEGAKHGEPALKMEAKSEGEHTMQFQSSLSALQAFSVGVAVIHSQTPSLYPKL